MRERLRLLNGTLQAGPPATDQLDRDRADCPAAQPESVTP